MRANSWLKLGLPLAFLAAALAGTARAQTDGSVTFRVTTSTVGGEYSPKNIVSVWVEDGSGAFVKTLYKRASTREQYLYQWIAKSSKNVVDAVTGATLSSHGTRTATWNCRNAAGALVPDGTYGIRVEMTDFNGQGPVTSATHIQFTKGASAVTVNPADFTYGGYTPFSSMQVVYTPLVLPHDIAVTGVAAPVTAAVGSTVSFTATVHNNTTTAESTIPVVLRNDVSGATLNTQTITALAGGASALPILTWDTTGLAEGTYDLSVTAGPVAGEGSGTDNVWTFSITLRAPIHDIAATAVTVPAMVAPASTPNVSVVVTNLGDFAETFSVSLRDVTANAAIGSQNVRALAAGAGHTLVYPWATAGLPQGARELQATAAPLANEWSRSDNTRSRWTAIATGSVARTYVARGAGWAYHDQGLNLHLSNWKSPDYFDGLWPSGPAQLGYGDGDEATVLDNAPIRPCYYFRRLFVADAAPSALAANLVRDDGAVVFINGVEALRSNMGVGATAFDQWAAAATPSATENSFWPFTLDPKLVRPGVNVVAVELHQSDAASSDISFDFELTGTGPAWTPARNVAVAGVRPAGDALQGDTVPVAVTVANLGNVIEHTTVTLSSATGGGTLGTQDVADLLPGATREVLIDWPTLGIPPGPHELRAAISPVAGDTAPANDALSATGTVSGTGFAPCGPPATGSVGGFCGALAVSGNFVYLGEGATIAVIDLAAPASPVLRSSLHVRGRIRSLACSGGTLYAACGAEGVHVVDVSNPDAPVCRVRYDTSGTAYGVTAAGALACVADGVRGVRILNVSAPASPTLLGMIPSAGQTRAVALAGTTLYAADQDGLAIVDVSTPSAPAVLGRLSGLGFGQSLAVAGTTVYMGDGDGVLHVISAATPAAPSERGRVRLSGPVSDLQVSGTTVYASVGAGGVAVVDASAPTAPTVVGTLPAVDAATGARLAGALLCVADGYAGLQVLDPAPPGGARIGAHGDVARARATVIHSGAAYVASGTQGIHVYSVTNPAAPVLVVTVASTNARDVALAGGVLAVADGDAGLRLLDISTPGAPALLGRYLPAAPMRGLRRVVGSGALAAITDGHTVELVSIATPGVPSRVGSFTLTSDFIQDLHWHGSLVLAAAGRTGLVVLDAAGGADLTWRSTLSLPGVATGVTTIQTNAFVAAGDAGVHVVNISNPDAPVHTGTQVGSPGSAVAASGSALHRASAQYLASANVDVPLTPVPLSQFGQLVSVLRVEAESNLVAVSEDDAGLALIGLGVPDSDGDGLDDAWERAIIDDNPGDDIRTLADVTAGGDYDGDGLSNGSEFAAGTSPVDPGSVFAITGVAGTAPGGGDVVIRWYSVAGKRYTVRRGESLATGFHDVMAAGIPATAPINSFTGTTALATAFFVVTVDP